jgi:NADH-quinone oxidoreductase subunit C
MTANLAEIRENVERAFAGRLVSVQETLGELTVTVTRESLLAVLQHLRDDKALLFICFIDLCGVDYPEREERFEVVYHLLSPKRNARIRLKVLVSEGIALPSATRLWAGADWFEREAWDMYGILFTGHPDLRRILTDYGFDGHPQRKDFPLTGYVEARYDDEAKRVVYEPVELRQEYRNFDFLSPWEGTEYVLPGDEKAK